MSPIRIDPLTEGDRWDELVRKHPGSTIFHSSAWARVLWETYRFRPFFHATEGEPGDAVPGILALAEVDSWITGRRGVSLPFADECSVLAGPTASFETIWERGLELGRERKWRTIEVRGVPEGNVPASLEYFHHVLPLSTRADDVFGRFEGSVRRAIRKAERSGVAVSIERTEEAIRTYYRLHCLTRKKHGLPPQSLAFFLAIWRHIVARGLGFVAVARLGAKPLAAAVFFEFQGRGLYKFGASDPAADSLRPSNQVMSRAIADLCERGMAQLDFGRTSLHQTGLRRYKLGWGCAEERIRYSKWNFRQGRFVQDVDRSAGWQNVFFRSCPSALARLCGRFIYPHIA